MRVRAVIGGSDTSTMDRLGDIARHLLAIRRLWWRLGVLGSVYATATLPFRFGFGGSDLTAWGAANLVAVAFAMAWPVFMFFLHATLPEQAWSRDVAVVVGAMCVGFAGVGLWVADLGMLVLGAVDALYVCFIGLWALFAGLVSQ